MSANESAGASVISRRDFLKTTGMPGAGLEGASYLQPKLSAAETPIKPFARNSFLRIATEGAITG
jgi:hypothetical protein